jgi:hypothetical protein
MSIVINGSGTITGISEGGLNDGIIVAADIKDATITPAKLNGAQSGSAPGYVARAWVNFNGTGTVAIRASGNVSSITDNGTGDYTLNFTTAMPNANYSVVGNARDLNAHYTFGSPLIDAPTTTAIRCRILDTQGNPADAVYVSAAIFR